MDSNITFTPTYLYIKQHSVTGLLYFGKTINKDPIKYKGSGTRWLNHINYHGKEFVETIWYQEFINKDELVKFALDFSIKNNIVKSDDWANLVLEDGINGGLNGYNHSDQAKIKLSIMNRGKILSKETRHKISESLKGKPKSEEHRLKMKDIWTGRQHTEESKIKMSENNVGMLGKIHSEETKQKMSESQAGRKHSDETKLKISEYNKGRSHPTIICPHCEMKGGRSAMKRYHFDNCKMKEFENEQP